MSKHLDPTLKHDAVILIDCLDGNPNGDPDAGNQPRIDPQTRQGLMTDACIKRKVRNYVGMKAKDLSTSERFKIFIEEGAVLNDTIARGYTELGIEPKGKKSKEGNAEQQEQVKAWIQENFYDVRIFGAVLTTGLKAGQVWGPMQVHFGRSIDPVLPVSHTITRCAATESKEDKENKTMGKKEGIPYGLYRSTICYNPHLASDLVTENDLILFWEALVKAWEFDRSASRGLMACQGLWVFSHKNPYGNYPAHKLFDLIQIQSLAETPRNIRDYEILVGEIPSGITLIKLA
ncbi:MAG: type I-C CRISPR-associated protein Cas7/Csd2 [Cyanobacteria bacterium J06592_8]